MVSLTSSQGPPASGRTRHAWPGARMVKRTPASASTSRVSSAADDETLEVLAEAGVRFTILAPGQAWRVRPLAGGPWDEVNDTIDPSRPYLWRGPRGLSLALFFYDGPISRAIAFENLLERGEKLVARLRAAFSDARN